MPASEELNLSISNPLAGIRAEALNLLAVISAASSLPPVRFLCLYLGRPSAFSLLWVSLPGAHFFTGFPGLLFCC